MGKAWWTPTTCVVVALVACSGGVPRGPTAQVVDSAGIRIVTYNLTDVAVAIYATVGEHDLEIGVLDGAAEYTFSSIPDVGVADDGSIVVSDAVSRELRMYDANGTHMATLGATPREVWYA